MHICPELLKPDINLIFPVKYYVRCHLEKNKTGSIWERWNLREKRQKRAYFTATMPYSQLPLDGSGVLLSKVAKSIRIGHSVSALHVRPNNSRFQGNTKCSFPPPKLGICPRNCKPLFWLSVNPLKITNLLSEYIKLGTKIRTSNNF